MNQSDFETNIDEWREKHKHPEMPPGTGLINLDRTKTVKYCIKCDQYYYLEDVKKR